MAGAREREYIENRKRKLEKLREMGVDPFPYRFDRTHDAGSIREEWDGKLGPEESSGVIVRIAGRVLSLRVMGGVSFAHVMDESGRIQVMFRKSDLPGEKYGMLKLLDTGDFVGVEGEVIKTRTGELTVLARDYELLAKALRPLPEKYHGLEDKELRYRYRYLDLIMNPEVRDVFRKRSQIIREIRRFLEERGFIEVETPVLQPVYGGASARPFITHHNALDMDLYLRISPELYLKRLIIGGFERVFEISRNFRNEGIDRTHNPEFTMIEIYQAYADYNDMMRLTEELWAHVAERVLGTTKITYQGQEIDLSPPWERLSLYDALKKHAGLDVEKMSDEELLRECEKHGIEIEPGTPRGLVINELFEKLVADTGKLVGPVFITDLPKETTVLCKVHRENPDLIERFEPYICGMEVGNAYSELNDPEVQRRLFEEQQKKLEQGDEEAHPKDMEFVRALEHGMPPTGGLGIGIDRMVMILTDQPSIRDVILFPAMRPRKESSGSGDSKN